LSIFSDGERLRKAGLDLSERVMRLKSDHDAIAGVVSEHRELLRTRAAALQHDIALFGVQRADFAVRADTIAECELQPLADTAQRYFERGAAAIQRLTYLKLWLTGETTAPPLELLLYFLVPIAHLEPLVGDLEEEYRTIQLPRFGPRAAQWWYTKHVIRTIACYAIWASKRAGAVAAAVDLFRRISHWFRY
jgi:hypothetical protein